MGRDTEMSVAARDLSTWHPSETSRRPLATPAVCLPFSHNVCASVSLGCFYLLLRTGFLRSPPSGARALTNFASFSFVDLNSYVGSCRFL